MFINIKWIHTLYFRYTDQRCLWSHQRSESEKLILLYYVKSSTEIGDGASCRVYLGTMKDKHVGIKQLKGYSNNQGAVLFKSYENFQYLNDHTKVAKIIIWSMSANWLHCYGAL